MHSLTDADNEENKKVKGTNKNLVKSIPHKEYVDILFNKKVIRDKWKEFKVNCIKLELVKFVKFLYLSLMIKDIY